MFGKKKNTADNYKEERDDLIREEFRIVKEQLRQKTKKELELQKAVNEFLATLKSIGMDVGGVNIPGSLKFVIEKERAMDEAAAMIEDIVYTKAKRKNIRKVRIKE